MPLPSAPPAGTSPPEYVEWATDVVTTASDHETRIDSLESGSGGTYATHAELTSETSARTTADADLQTQVNAKADNAAVVKLVGNQSVDGIKTFTSTPVVPGASLAADQAAGVASPRTLGTGATQAAAGNDSRLSDARTPAAHAATHGVAGSDPVTIAESQVTNLTADLALLAPKANAALTGNPTAPTPTAGDADTSIATTAFVADAVATAVTGLLDYRSVYDASTNLFPSTGGSGAGGAVAKSDWWIVSVGGTLGGTAVTAGDWVVAKQDAPGQTAGNWSIIEHDLGYAPEDSANKSNDTTLAADSATLYPTQHAVKTALAAKANTSSLGTAAGKNTGVTVLDPGTGALEHAIPPASTSATTGATKTYVALDRGKIYYRSNGGAAMSDTLPALTNTVADIGWYINVYNEDTALVAALTMNASGGALFRGNDGVTSATSPIAYGCRQGFVWSGTQWILFGGNANQLRRTGAIVAGEFPAFSDTAGNVVTSSGVSAATVAAKVSGTRAVNTTTPLTGGGTLASDLTLAISAATGLAAGSQSAADNNRIRKEWDAYADFGIICNLRSVGELTIAGTQVVMTSGSNIVNIPNGGATTPFQAGRDEGKRITVQGAGASGAVLDGFIGVVNSGTQCTVLATVGGSALNASTTVTAGTAVQVWVQWGTDNTTAVASMVTTINNQAFPCPKITWGKGGLADWTNAVGFKSPVIFNKPVWWEGIGGSHTTDVGDYTKTGGTRWAWWGTSSDGGAAFGAMVTLTPPGSGAATPAMVRSTTTPSPVATSVNAIGNLASAPANGNVLIAWVSAALASETITPPAGWNLLSGPLAGGGTTYTTWVYWKVASSEPATWTWVLGHTENNCVTVAEYTGVSTATPTVGAAAMAGGTTINSPVITTPANNSIVIQGVTIVNGFTGAIITIANPANTTQDSQGGTNLIVNNNVSSEASHDTANQAAAGSTTARTFTMSGAVTNAEAWTIAMAPASSGSAVQAIKRPRFNAGWFDGRNGDQNQALYLLKLASCHGAMIDDGVLFMDALAQALWMDVATSPSEAADNTRFKIDALCFRQLDNNSVTAPVTTPIATTAVASGGVLPTSAGITLTFTSNPLTNGFSATGGYAWCQTIIGRPVLIKYSTATTTTLTGCIVSAEDVLNTPTTVVGANVVACTPGNGGAAKFDGPSAHNTCCGTFENFQISHGSTWGPAALDVGNADLIDFAHGFINGGSNVNDGLINRQRKPGIRVNGSKVTAAQSGRNITIDDVDPGGAPAGPLGGISVMGVDNAGTLLGFPAGPVYIVRQQMANGAPVPTVEQGCYVEWSGNGLWNPGPLGAAIAVATTISAAGNVVLAVPAPPQGWQIGTTHHWHLELTKGAVGTTLGVGIRTASTPTTGSGTLIGNAAFTGTAVADAGSLDIYLGIVGPLGASAVPVSTYFLNHNLAITGLGTGAVTAGTLTSATAPTGSVHVIGVPTNFNSAAPASGPMFLFLDINTGSTALTIQPGSFVECLKAANP